MYDVYCSLKIQVYARISSTQISFDIFPVTLFKLIGNEQQNISLNNWKRRTIDQYDTKRNIYKKMITTYCLKRFSVFGYLLPVF